MVMMISAHCNITNPEKMGYPYLESIRSFSNFCDEVIVVDGGSTDGSLAKIKKIPNVRIIKGEKWARDFDWKVMPRNLQLGYEACNGDWAFHFDVDYIFHEDNVSALVEEVNKSWLPAIEIKKINFVLINETFDKGHIPILLNKKEFASLAYGIGEDSKGNEVGTFLRPITKVGAKKGSDGLYHGDTVHMSSVRLNRTNIPVYTYDFSFMTKEQVIEQRQRFENALLGFRGSEKKVSKQMVYKEFIGMMKYRHDLCKIKDIKIESHSRFIREKVKGIKQEMFAYNMWGEL